MVKLKEPILGGLCRRIDIDGFGDYANPKRVRFTFYSIHMAMPESDEEDSILQLVRENELVFEREVFLKFAERVSKIKKWMEKHEINPQEMSKEEINKYIGLKGYSNEILAIWAGQEMKIKENMPLGLIPLFPEEERESEK